VDSFLFFFTVSKKNICWPLLPPSHAAFPNQSRIRCKRYFFHCLAIVFLWQKKNLPLLDSLFQSSLHVSNEAQDSALGIVGRGGAAEACSPPCERRGCVLSKLASLLHTPYVTIRQHTPAYARYDGVLSKLASLLHTHPYVYRRTGLCTCAPVYPYVYRRTGTQSEISHSHTDTDALMYNTRTHLWRTHSCTHAPALSPHTHTHATHTLCFQSDENFENLSACYVHVISHGRHSDRLKKMKKKAWKKSKDTVMIPCHEVSSFEAFSLKHGKKRLSSLT
jgi:hypothetical protein